MATISSDSPAISRSSSPVLGSLTTSSSTDTPRKGLLDFCKLCISETCPIGHPHEQGVYLHSCRVPISNEARRLFAPSVPSSDIVASYERWRRHESTKTDLELWMAFHEQHVEPLLKNVGSAWVVPVPAKVHDDDLTFVHCRDPGLFMIRSRNKARHPFGLANPPQEVWEAHRRIRHGIVSSKDEDLVNAFALENAYERDGSGEQERMARRFKTRRARQTQPLFMEDEKET